MKRIDRIEIWQTTTITSVDFYDGSKFKHTFLNPTFESLHRLAYLSNVNHTHMELTRSTLYIVIENCKRERRQWKSY